MISPQLSVVLGTWRRHRAHLSASREFWPIGNSKRRKVEGVSARATSMVLPTYSVHRDCKVTHKAGLRAGAPIT